MLEKTPQNTMDSHENKLMDHQTNWLRILIWGVYDQAEVIHYTHYTETQLSEQGSNAGK